MATEINVNKGWLKDANDNYFAPKTLVSQIFNEDGASLNNILIEKSDTIKAYAKEYVDKIIDDMIGEESVGDLIKSHNLSSDAHDFIQERINKLESELDDFTSISEETIEQLNEALDLIKNNEELLNQLGGKLSKTDVIDRLDYNGSDVKALSATAGATLYDTFTSHINASGDNSPHITKDERSHLVAAYKHANEVAHAPSNIVASNGISITTDTTNDKITINNTGIREISISSGDSNGSIKVSTNGGTPSEVTVKGLKNTAFTEAGDLTAGKASALDISSAIGSETDPIYFNASGKPVKCSKYAGATKVKLNGVDKDSADINIYAPTTSPTDATKEYILKGNANGAPTWVEHKHDDKQNSIEGAASSITSSDLTANRVLISDSNGKVAISDLNSDKLEYLLTVEDDIQAQIDTLADQLGGYTITYSTTPPTTTDTSIITLVPRGAK